MARRSKTGVRGLHLVDDHYEIDFRYKDASTGQRRRYRETLPPTTSATAAKHRATRVTSGLLDGTWLSAAPRNVIRLDAALDRYLEWAETNRPQTWETKKSLANVLKHHLGNPRLDELHTQLEAYKAKRTRGGTAPATINRSLIMLRHLMNMGVKWGLVTRDEAHALRNVDLLKEPPGRVRYFTDDEQRQIMARLPANVGPIVEAARLSGMRRGELVRLRKSAVDLDARIITLIKTKTNRIRRVPINDALANVLRGSMANSSCEFVFVSPQGTPYVPRSVTRAFSRARELAKIEDLRFHDTRHDFATKVRRAGADIDTIRELLGHTTVAMASRYAHLGKQQLHEAVETLKATESGNTSNASQSGDASGKTRREQSGARPRRSPRAKLR